MEEVTYEGGDIPPMQITVYLDGVGYYVSSYEKNDDGTVTAILKEWVPF